MLDPMAEHQTNRDDDLILPGSALAGFNSTNHMMVCQGMSFCSL